MIFGSSPVPLFMSAELRETGQTVCIVTWSSRRSSAVGRGPLELRAQSRRAMVLSPSFGPKVIGGLFGFTSCAVVSAACLPKTTRSSKELAPSLLAPWTEAEAASPAARTPGTTVLHLPFKIWHFQLVGMPPML